MALDKIDRKILFELQHDAGRSVADISESVNLSKAACWRRIQKLEAEGIISSRVALLDPKKLNLGMTAYIAVRTSRHNQTWAEQFQEIIDEIPELLEVYRMAGEVDYLIKAAVKDMDHFDRVYKRLIKADLFDVSSSFVMETMKHTTALPLNQLD